MNDQIVEYRSDGNGKKTYMTIVGGKTYTVTQIMKQTGLARTTVLDRIKNAVDGRLPVADVIKVPFYGNMLAVMRRNAKRVPAKAELFSEVERLAFCKPWA